MPTDNRSSAKAGRKASDFGAVFQFALEKHKSGDLVAAIDCYNKALRIAPSAPDALNNLGVALREANQRSAAVIAYRRLLALHPPSAATLVNLGNVLRELGEFKECQASYVKALELEPNARGALYGLGLLYRDWNKLDESLTHLDAALRQQPDDADLNWDRAQTLLRMGDYERGFEAYEWRWKLARGTPRTFDKPEWGGDDLNGRSLLLYGEQGFGDAIQFARFIPQLAEANNTNIFLEVRPELVRLFEAQITGVKQVIARGSPMPNYDCQFPLMSLPRVLKTNLATIPTAPYLQSKPGLIKIPAAKTGEINVGVAWAGSPTQANDRNRTFRLEDMLPLLQLPHCRFFSLQKGEGSKQLDQLGVRHAITSVGGIVRDFADTSAVINDLDLLITADTSVAHLAGAMGKPVWIALSVFHDWRYDASGSISGWYPQARVFRQEEPGNWATVFQKMVAALKDTDL